MKLSHFALPFALASFGAAAAHAQCQTWSNQFGNIAFNGDVRCLATVDDGSGEALYACGSFNSSLGTSTAHLIARWRGGTWTALGGGLGGLGSGGAATALSCAAFDDGSGPALYVGGSFTLAGGAQARNFAKWDGAHWSEVGGGVFSPNGSSVSVLALAVFDDGSGPALYVAGSFAQAGGQPMKNIARWTSNGWSSIGDADSTVIALTVFDDGSGPALYAGGTFLSIGGVSAAGVARWNGSSWSALGGGNWGMDSFAVYDDGSGPALISGGWSIARWDGAAWHEFGSNPSAAATSLASFDDGSGEKLYVGGEWLNYEGVPVHNVVRWNGSAWSDVAGGTNSAVYALHTHDDGWGAKLYAGGFFTTAGGAPAGKIARFDGQSWSGAPGSQGIPNQVRALAAYDDGSGGGVDLYAGGAFVGAGTSTAHYVARWNGSTWSDVAGGTNSFVDALATWNGSMYAGGNFTQAGGSPASGIARFDGVQWHDLDGGVAGDVKSIAVFDDGSGPALYVGGVLASAGSSAIPVHNIARWNGSAWSDVGGGVTWLPGPSQTVVSALTAFDDGSGPALYAGGKFTDANGTAVNHIARWNGASWSALGAGLGFFSNSVSSLAVYDDRLGGGPALYAGGDFGGGVSRWDGAQWNDTVAPVSALALTVFDDGSGPQLCAGGSPAQNLGLWNGTAWSLFGSGVGNQNGDKVLSLIAHDDGSGPALFVAGQFNVANGNIPSGNVAKWQGCAPSALLHCFGDGSEPGLVACPCGNVGASGRGCDNSAGTGGALLAASGVASTALDTLVLHASGELPSALSVFLQGDATIATGALFGDGIRCAGGHLSRLAVKSAHAGSVHFPEHGDASISARAAALGGALVPGETREYQVYYRDPNPTFCPAPLGNTWNVTNAASVVWY